MDNIVKVINQQAQEDPNSLIYSFLNDKLNVTDSLTYQELNTTAKSIAAKLQTYQVYGERILIILPQSLDYLKAFFGTLYAGAIAVPCCVPNRRKHSDRILKIIQDSKAKFVITSPEIRDIIQLYLKDFYLSDEVKIYTLPELLALTEDWQMPSLRGESLAFLQYTSSSTGEPKAVMVSHSNLIANLEMIKTAFHQKKSSVFLSWLPLFHDMGLIVMALAAPYVGSHTYLMAPIDFIKKPFIWLKGISQYKANFTAAPNFAYDLCINHITDEELKELDLSSWQIALNGAEPVRSKTITLFTEKFSKCGFQPTSFFPAYGLAEATVYVSSVDICSLPVFYPALSNKLEEGKAVFAGKSTVHIRTLVSCGKSRLDGKILIVDPETLQTCPSGKIGEIWLSGSQVAQGYWNKPIETEKTFQAYTKDSGEGPFLRTGDLGFLHDDELFITGRLKDLIIICGRNHAPQDIEYTVEQCHPKINPHGVAAFSWEENDQEKLVIMTEIKSGESINHQDICQAIERAVSREHALTVSDVVFLKPRELPKTTSGKIQRQKCKTQYLESIAQLV